MARIKDAIQDQPVAFAFLLASLAIIAVGVVLRVMGYR